MCTFTDFPKLSEDFI